MTALPHYTTSARNNKVNSTLIVTACHSHFGRGRGRGAWQMGAGVWESATEGGNFSSGNMLPGNGHK